MPSKQSKPVPAKQSKLVKEKSTKPTPLQKVGKGKVRKVRNVKSSLQLIDEPDEEQAQSEPEPEPQGEQVDYDLQRGIQMSLESFQPPVSGVDFHEPTIGITHKLPIVEGKGKNIATNEQVAQSLCKNSAKTDKTNSEGDTEILNIVEEQGEDVANQVNLEDRTAEIDEGRAGSDPGKTPEFRPSPERVLRKEDQAGPDPGQSHVALAGPDLEPMHKDFVVTVYPQVHESLKHTDEEHVHALGKTNMETKVESMVTVLIHQASSSIPPLSTPVIDITPPKPVSSIVGKYKSKGQSSAT
ncbi:hypothetical protein Tco_0990893 [Tanacetum coccineum]|uniref:Uncharacterized protein n=1 Tax=Tanacetum coccineum TaxID=301880 RepID=A0ABQ5EYE4_9ASTR